MLAPRKRFPVPVGCCLRHAPEKRRAHLPPDKQFLITKNVPCFPREEKEVHENIVEGEKDSEDGWVVANIKQDEADDDDGAGGETGAAGAAGPATAATTTTDQPAAPVTDEDIDNEFDAVETVGDGDVSFDTAGLSDQDTAVAAADDTHVKQTRTYDISIHYDAHYSTPRVWLFGYDANHNPLKGNEWQEDFSPEHVNKTVTFETHPHLGYSCPSIHPCKHAEAMKNMVDLLVGPQGNLDPKVYLLIFLKFIQAIIPNIEYDYTSRFQFTQQPEEGGDGAAAAAASGASGFAASS